MLQVRTIELVARRDPGGEFGPADVLASVRPMRPTAGPDPAARHDATATLTAVRLVDTAQDGAAGLPVWAGLVPEPRAAAETVRRRRGGLDMAGSLLAHAALLGWLVWLGLATPTPGGGGHELDSISVDMVSAAVVESLMARTKSGDGGGAAPIEAAPGQQAPVAQPEIAAAAPTPSPAPEPVKPPPAVVSEPDPAPAREVGIVAAPVIKPALETPPKPVPPVEREAGKSAHKIAAQPALAPGGAAAWSPSPRVATDGAAGATAGQLARYAMDVRMALGRVRPRHAGLKGRVQILFALDAGGGVHTAQVLRSSGNARLDQASLEAVRRASFPAPPAGASEKQRTFSVPFEFR